MFDEIQQSGLDFLSPFSRLQDGVVGAPSYSFLNDPDCGMYRIGANDYGFAVNGALVLEFTATAILPGGDNTIDLGSAAKSIKNLYVDTIVYVADEVISGNIYGSGAANWGIYANAAVTDGTARTFSISVLDTTGNAWKEMFRATPDIADPWASLPYKTGIGMVTEPSAPLHVYDDATGIWLGNTVAEADKRFRIYLDTTNFTLESYKDAATAGYYPMSIQASSLWLLRGNVLIGSATSYGRLGQLLEVNVSANYGGLALNTWSAVNAVQDSILDFNRSKSSTIGTYTIVASGDILGRIVFNGADGVNWQESAGIYVYTTGTIAENRVPGQIIFNCYSDIAASVELNMLTLKADAVVLSTCNATQDVKVDRLSLSGAAAIAVATWTNVTHSGLNITSGEVLKVNSVQVVGPRVIDARCDDTIAGAGAYDDTTAGVIDALRDAMIAHGLIAAA